MTPYSNMTIWELEQERAKIEAELKTRYLVRGDAPRPEGGAREAIIEECADLCDQHLDVLTSTECTYRCDVAQAIRALKRPTMNSGPT